ncbi:MAG TPA: M20/M25/M40 family metallo-hydrolase [Thermoanaerobaculia bacterium]|nr:M20/M25/M40 family metallo-hydrolase [Thermoanaerobaculia bacterium]
MSAILTSAERLLQDLCAISSESGNASGIRRVAEMLARALTPHGLSVDIIDEPDAHGVPQPVLIARGPASGGAHLLLLGHMDTVLPAVVPRVEGRTLFATGSYDMKAGLVALCGALEALASRGTAPPPDLLVVLVPDEESESLISGRSAERWSRGARAVLVLEPGQATADGETLVAGRRGMMEWTLDVRGQASHSGLAYWSGRSALAAAADWCAQAQAASRRGNGPTVNVGRIVGGSTDFVDDLGQHAAMLGSSRQLNVVSDRAVAEGELRFLTAADGQAMRDELERLAAGVAARHETEVVFSVGMHVPPVDPHGPGAPLIRRAVELASGLGFRLDVEEDRGGISFPNFIADPASTPVIDGLGPVGYGMHIRGESVDLDSLGRRIALLADLLPTL